MAENNSYTQSQILTMQQDAVRRVNEMRRLSQEKLAGSSGGISPTMPQDSTGHQPPPSNAPEQQNEPEQPSSEDIPAAQAEVLQGGFTGILEKLNLDDEKLIIIMLLFLLINEGADIKVILALVYILL